MPKKKPVEIPATKTQEPARLLTVKEAARTLGCSESWLYKMVEWNQIECKRLGLKARMIRFDAEQLTRIVTLVPTKKVTNA